MQLAVVGSTNVRPEQRSLAFKIVEGFVLVEKPSVIISGGAAGIDNVADQIAYLHEIKFVEHLPKNNRWEPDGYKERNTKIAQDCTHLLCIRTQQSTTYGSGWTADLAERLGKTVWRVILP